MNIGGTYYTGIPNSISKLEQLVNLTIADLKQAIYYFPAPKPRIAGTQNKEETKPGNTETVKIPV